MLMTTCTLRLLRWRAVGNAVKAACAVRHQVTAGPRKPRNPSEVITTSNSTPYQREDESRSGGIAWVDGHTVDRDKPGMHRDPSSDVDWQHHPSEECKRSNVEKEKLFTGPGEGHAKDRISSFSPLTANERRGSSGSTLYDNDPILWRQRDPETFPEWENYFPGATEHLTDFESDREMIKAYNFEVEEWRPRDFRGVDAGDVETWKMFNKSHAPTPEQDTRAKTGATYTRSEADDNLK